MSQTTGWVFLSHSHLDIEIVRKIRNMLEEMGFNPLTFYLKCLTDDDEVADLIKREIRERDWFVFVNSDNSRVSKWVQTERDYIEEIGGKNVYVIDSDTDDEKIAAELTAMASQMQITVVSVEEDAEYRESIESLLLAHDYIVLSKVISKTPETREDLEALLDRGTVILLITENNRLSEECHNILDEMVVSKKRIMPLYSESVDYDSMLSVIYKDLSGTILKKNPGEEDRERIFTLIRRHICMQRDDFIASESFRSAKVIQYPEAAQIPDYAFTDCTLLEEVFIPDTVEYISSKAFYQRESVLVRCSPGSHAEAYCRKHKIRYETEETGARPLSPTEDER